ncbi:MAG: type III ribulose-bisphosphate carboxylase [Candidatus Aenigmarchaeota archaeon]|nr:type III ribulose-bisphosphate carboxylase [Candidatus Aenigmarchaeota archaeon]
MDKTLDYINLKYTPTKNDLVVLYRVEPNKISIETACEHLAAESSIGTWTEISTMNPRVAKKLKPTVFSIDKKTKMVKIAYTKDLFENANMPEILSSIAGNIFGMSVVKNLRLVDIYFPKSIVDSFKGPAFGIEGIRKLTRIKERPLVGTIIKPKVGLNEKEHAQVAYNAWVGGLDVVKDDENLTSMSFNNFDLRVKETLNARDIAERKTGEKKIYMPNVTAETTEMLRRANLVKKQGGEYIMVDILTLGWSALQTLRDANLGLVIHAHRAMHAAITRNPKHGISMLVLAKVTRLIGADQLHIGTAQVGKMTGEKDEVIDIENAIEYSKTKSTENTLGQNWQNIKTTLAVASGGLHPGHIPKLLSKMGTNIVAQFGGGCHGHPQGTIAGAKAIRQATNAYMKKIPAKTYAKTAPELKCALEHWK